MRSVPHGWSSSAALTADGATRSEQRVSAERPVVEQTEAGAAELGDVYWREVERFMHGLVRARVAGNGSVELRLRPGGVALIRFGAPELAAPAGLVSCRYPIVGGFLVRRAGGSISFSQETGADVELASGIEGFFPRFGAAPGRPRWTGALYQHVQSRLHLAVSKRYFKALVTGSRP